MPFFINTALVKNSVKKGLLPVLAMSLAGCVTMPEPSGPKEADQAGTPDQIFEMMALPMPDTESQEIVNGSLFNPSYSSSLYEDRMAYRVGDILTVVLDEQTRSNTSSGTDFRKDNSVNLPGPLLFGRKEPDSGMSMDRRFSGSGSSTQQNMLDGSITVSVLKVLPNRTLLVRGEKWLTLNQGDDYIRVSGILRPEDIAPDNSVSSQRLASARLVFSGDGPLADANEAGWLMRFFNSPVMPM
ncbi:flagellar basal body L-ring protein FlgH [Endozoicomonas montiporae]|nr:flagellar basal body L-ring protein FlgH [Endozoicomonas montiporae]AMO56380.1 flagellar basal body L-ring protein FlgH [Endozoicomonas montiporae CL-33]